MVVSPVGPLPASTYWRRRLVLLLGLLLLLLVLRSCLGGSSDRRPVAAPRPSPTATRSTASPSPSPSLSPTPAPVAVAPLCADSALTVTTSTDAATYPVGTSPRLSLIVTNTGPRPCRRDLGGGAVELVVLSGADRIWSSDDCNPSSGSDLVLLAPGKARTTTLSWSGRRSRPGCTGTREQAQPGTYRVTGRAGTLHGAGGAFVFR